MWRSGTCICQEQEDSQGETWHALVYSMPGSANHPDTDGALPCGLPLEVGVRGLAATLKWHGTSAKLGEPG